MFCQQCGAPLEADSRFCSKCGAPVSQGIPDGGQAIEAEHSPSAESVQETSQSGPAMPQEQPQYGGYVPPQGQAPYDSYTQPQGQMPYGGYTPQGGYPPYGGAYKAPKKGMSKKAKALMFGGIGLVAVLGIAAILIFVVFAGGAWPLSGNTIQTRFVNDGARVLAGAFSDFSVLKMPDISDQPFDLESSISVKGEEAGLETPASMDFDIAYDQQTLGVVADLGYLQLKMLLLEDTLYVDSGYGATGIRFDTDADLSKPMSLKNRLAALSKNNSAVDYKKLVEAFLNSIDEKCFDKNSKTFTLELTALDLQDALDAFSKKLDSDKALRDEMENMLESMGQKDVDTDEMLSQAISGLDYADFNVIMEIAYEDGAPVAINITAEEGGTTTEILFGYEKSGDSKIITLDIDGESDYADGTIELTVKKTGEGLDLDGSISSYESLYELSGSLRKSGNSLSGSFDVSGNGTDYGTVEFDCSIKTGAPSKAVEDDKRFKIDTSEAEVQDLEDALGYSLPYMGMNATAPAVSAAPEVSAVPSMAPVATAAPAIAEYSIMGVLLPSNEGDYYSDMIDAYEDLADQYGVTVMLEYADYDTSTQQAQAQMLLASGVDVLIVEPVYADTAAAILSMASAAGVPVVFTGADSQQNGSENYVTMDFNEAGSMIASMCPPGDICVISSMEGISMSTDMENGLQDRLDDTAGYTIVDKEYAIFDAEAGKTLASEMIDKYSDASAIVCLDPMAAEGALQVLSEAKYDGKVVVFIDHYNLGPLQTQSTGLDVSYVYFDLQDMAKSAFFIAQDLRNGTLSEHASILPILY
jgi:ABC-type sugar transport system substrate-binding protein